MADRYLLETSATDGYLLEDGTGVLLLEGVPGIDLAPDPVAIATAVPTPTLEGALDLAPDPVAIATAVPIPTLEAGEIVLTPLPVAVVTTLSTPATIEAGLAPPPEAGTGGGATITASDRGAKGAIQSVHAELVAHSSGFYGLQPPLFWPDGAEVVTFRGNGDVGGGPGFPLYVPTPKSGPIEYISVPADPPRWRGYLLTARAALAISSVGRFGGVAGGNTSITVHVRQNGAIIGAHTEVRVEQDLNYWGGIITINLADVAVMAEDELTVSVTFINWVGFQFYASIPADGPALSQFFISGKTLPAGPLLRAHVTFAASL